MKRVKRKLVLPVWRDEKGANPRRRGIVVGGGGGGGGDPSWCPIYNYCLAAISPQRRSFCARLRRISVAARAPMYIMCHRRSFSVIQSVFHQTSVNASCHLVDSYIHIILYYIVYIYFAAAAASLVRRSHTLSRSESELLSYAAKERKKIITPPHE